MLLKKKAYRKGIGFIRVLFSRKEDTICKVYSCRREFCDKSDPICNICDVVLRKKEHEYGVGKEHLSYIPCKRG